ncbi:hypothetical protein KJ359_002083 [Pestalotiopsis sp. 9143b]|nr:hypothetical protein KJ359_002083 [Pestalotiopsis sp. 9143b]
MASNDDIKLYRPSKYLPKDAENQLTTPGSDFFCRTWAVAYSTLSMWRSAQNVRITYKALDSGDVDDLVEYEKGGKLKNVKGVDKPLGPGSYNWRGKGMLKPFTSYWEVLGWGEQTAPDREVERWLVIWFAKTLFTEEGVDILTDRKEGLSEQTFSAITTQLKEMKDAKDVVAMIEKKLNPVAVKLPWISSDS